MLWRVSRHRDLAGAGGLRAPGRWHERGLPVVYLAETPAELYWKPAPTPVPTTFLRITRCLAWK